MCPIIKITLCFLDNNIFNDDPDFEAPFDNLLRIGQNSGANGICDPNFIISIDILGETRTSPPDAGAYKSTVFED